MESIHIIKSIQDTPDIFAFGGGGVAVIGYGGGGTAVTSVSFAGGVKICSLLGVFMIAAYIIRIINMTSFIIGWCIYHISNNDGMDIMDLISCVYIVHQQLQFIVNQLVVNNA
eukprot:523686_1